MVFTPLGWYAVIFIIVAHRLTDHKVHTKSRQEDYL